MICIRGYSSPLAAAVAELLPEGEAITVVGRGETITRGERHLFCQGILTPKLIEKQSQEQIAKSFWVNAGEIIRQCEIIFEKNDAARVCVIGSESGFVWSYDGAYAAAKAALHRYVETKRLRTPKQQLVCIAPSIIEDGGMTVRRTDTEVLATKGNAHPKGRFLTCAEVAKLIYHVLYIDEGYLSGVVLRMNGGGHT